MNDLFIYCPVLRAPTTEIETKMSQFIATGNIKKITKGNDEVVQQDSPHLPVISLNDFRESMRVDDDVSEQRALRQLKSATYAINADIQHFIDGLTAALNEREIHLYQDAVYNRAKSSIMENYRDINTQQKGNQHAQNMEQRADDYKQKSLEAQRLLLGESRMSVELI